MTVYKCDMCGKYVDDLDDVYVVTGICKPNREYYGFAGQKGYFGLCPNCSSNLMSYIYGVRKEHGLEE